jgi:WD40 repeat protein/serine/threonine protein kinase
MDSSTSKIGLEGPVNEKLCRRACAELRRRLRGGATCRSEDIFADCPGLLEQPDFAVEVIYTEFVAAEEAGRVSPAEEWFGRFPQFRQRLERLFQVHAQLGAVTPPDNRTIPMRAAPEKRVGDYELLEELGRGGMGVVYLSRQPRLDRLVAIKMILAGAHADPVHQTRFLAEAKAVARLHHPNIVQIFEVGEHKGCPFLALEYVRGGSLDKLQRGEPMAQPAAAALVETLARAIHHAHENGIIHRDLKPENVLFQKDEGRETKDKAKAALALIPRSSSFILQPKITDFGLAKDLADENGMTQTGAVLGTPSYMAPEQARGGSEDIGPATDVYALGAILYELLTGRPPFKGDSPSEILEQVRHQEPTSVKKLQPKTAPDLETITHKCLSKEPWRRYGTALALAEDLARFQADEPIRARPISSLERVIRWCRRQPALAGLIFALVAVFLCGFAGVTWKWHDALIESAAKEEALEHEISERRSKELALTKANENLYFRQVALADREWAENNVGYAQRLLENCPEELRQWEWRYLFGLCRSGFKHSDPGALSIHVQFQPEGDCIGLSSERTRVRLWNITTGVETGSVPRAVRWHGLLPCNRQRDRLAKPGEKDTALSAVVLDVVNRQPLIREAVRGTLIGSLPALEGDEEPVTISHNGQMLVTLSRTERLLRLRSTESGKELHQLPSAEAIGQGRQRFYRDWYKMFVFRPDDRELAAISSGIVQIWDVDRGVLKGTLTPKQGGRVNCLSYRWDGKKLAAGTSERHVVIWDLATQGEERSLAGHTDEVLEVDYSPDGKNLASAGMDRSVRVWNPDRGSLYRYYRGHSRTIRGVAFSPNSQSLVSVDMDGTVRTWKLNQPQEATVLFGHKDAVVALAFAPNGQELLSTGRDGTIRVWNPNTGENVRTDASRSSANNALAYRPDGQQFAVAGDDRVVRLYSPKGEATGVLSGHSADITALAFSPNSQRLASAARDGTARIWDLQAGQTIYTLKSDSNWVSTLAFSPDGKVLAMAGQSDKVMLWDAGTGQLLASLGPHRLGVTYLAYHPSGMYLAAADQQGVITCWDIANRSVLTAFLGHSFGVYGMVFDRSGSRLYSSSQDQTVKVWDTMTGNPALTLPGHQLVVISVALSPDNQVLASAGADRTIRLWRADPP